MTSRFQVFHLGDARLRWRLVAGNNKVLGKGSREHGDVPSVRAELEQVRAAAREGATGLHRTAQGWTWSLVAAAETLATSSRAFQRRTEAELSATRFCTLAHGADVQSVVAVYPGAESRRRLRR